MNTLEYFYEIDFSKSRFLPRKYNITNDKTYLIGAPQSGKSTIIYQYLSEFDSSQYLYIDLDDYRLNINQIEKTLQNFIDNNNIKILVLKNIKSKFTIPNAQRIIISSSLPIPIDGFEILHIYPLDFEEFILYDRKFVDEERSFNHFFTHGNLPHNSISTMTNKEYQNMLKIFFDATQISIIKALSHNMGIKNSLLSIYNSIKKGGTKLSKDKFYQTIEELENMSVLFFLGKINASKSTKRIYLFDFILKEILSIESNIFKKLDNMIFLEINNQNQSIFYTDHISFYLPNQNRAIISIPFINDIDTVLKNKKLLYDLNKYNIKTLEVVSLGYKQSINHTCNIEILPFWEWAIKTSK